MLKNVLSLAVAAPKVELRDDVTIDLIDYDQKARAAVQALWAVHRTAHQKQIESGKTDQGERAGVTAGKNMDGFIGLISDLIRANGLTHVSIHLKRWVVTVPGYFRPTKLVGCCCQQSRSVGRRAGIQESGWPIFWQQFQQPNGGSDWGGPRPLDGISRGCVRRAAPSIRGLVDPG